MYAPRAKFERIFIVSPIKVAIIFLTSLHCIFLFVAVLTSFWIETKNGHYGPLFSCEKRFIRTNDLKLSMTTECYFGGFFHDVNLFWIPITGVLLILSLFISVLAVVIATLSFLKDSYLLRHQYWFGTIISLLFACIIDCFVLIFIPLSYRQQVYFFDWAYGVHCGATLFISVSLIAARLMLNADDVQYIEAIVK